jgi:hypothetical protein
VKTQQDATKDMIETNNDQNWTYKQLKASHTLHRTLGVRDKETTTKTPREPKKTRDSRIRPTSTYKHPHTKLENHSFDTLCILHCRWQPKQWKG